MLKKNKKLIIAVLLVALLIISYKPVRQYIRDFKQQSYDNEFNDIIKEAAKTSPNIWDEKYKNNLIKDKYKVVFIINNGGEASYAEYFKYAAEKKGWDVQIYYAQIRGHEAEILKFDPDFIIFSQFASPELNTHINSHRSRKYVLSFSSLEAIRNRFKWISPKDPYKTEGNLQDYVSSVHGILTIAPEIDFYKTLFEKSNKPFNGLRLLPLVPEFYNEPAEPKKLMWISGGWDAFRSSKNYKRFISLLSENVPMKVYGHYNSSAYLKSSVYGGYIPPGIEMINAIRKNGIYLLTHSDLHFKGGEPNMRGFEAAAANVVIISDKHPFIVKSFGDSLLYFDNDVDADIMYKQVKDHMDWIKANPKKAKAMAEKAHKIYLEKFTIEVDLVRVAKMHEGVLNQEKELDLQYNLGY